MKYENPIMEIVNFEEKDVVTASLTEQEIGGTSGSGWSDWF